MGKIRALLLDIDGTLVTRNAPVPGAKEAISFLRASNIPFRLLTNISAQHPENIAAQLCASGLEVRSTEILTSATACAAQLRHEDKSITDYFLPPQIKPLFAGIRIDNDSPDVVVLGDAQHAFSFENINRAFCSLHNGAVLMATHRNMYWYPTEGIQIDCGAFVAALEAANGTKALITGKPSVVFFQSAVRELQVLPEEVLVVGDDAMTDLLGARSIGARSALVRTGKGEISIRTGIPANIVIDSIADLPNLLANLTV